MEGSPIVAGYVYHTPWPAYAIAWANRVEPRMRLAVGSFWESENAIHVVELNEETGRLEKVAGVAQAFPPTKLLWKPSDGALGETSKDGNLLAACSTAVELFQISDGQLKSTAKLPAPKLSPPVTSMDWSSIKEHKLAISSVDTTICIYDLNKMKIETQLIAHDKAVFDIALGQRESIASLFCSCGLDGSIRLFDERNLEHSTIIFDNENSTPLLRLSWNKSDKNYVAAFGSDSKSVIVVDLRKPSVSLKELPTHGAFVNAISWAPHSRSHLLAGTEDGGTLIWKVNELTGATDPSSGLQALQYDAQYEVQSVQWPESMPNHIALGTTRKVEVLQI